MLTVYGEGPKTVWHKNPYIETTLIVRVLRLACYTRILYIDFPFKQVDYYMIGNIHDDFSKIPYY